MNNGMRIVVLAAADASTRPVASGPPPSCAAWGAAIPGRLWREQYPALTSSMGRYAPYESLVGPQPARWKG